MNPEREIANHKKKRHYPTKKEARKVMKRLRATRLGRHRSVYKCPVCGEWCITSRPKKMQY